ncbi:hypothetical protein DCS_05458 [Drechmeria coniospora]|uniref:HbrB-like protein n=1 Tax=Drechmeria coniospora TaxID=98403 RepID=A0A151GN71_DRECN|nr:hypothetical protein DCS_05458 [Drechmeria coniospora]KYK58442.1 hypothetical protein DCS_05458 [Drechmeria coniospora]
MFDSNLPSTSTSNLSHVSMTQPAHSAAAAAAAAVAVMAHQNHGTAHARQRSQTVPFPGEANDRSRRGSGSKAPLSPPLLSLTEASAPRDSAFGPVVGHHQHPQDRFAGSHSSAAAAAAASLVFPRSGQGSPGEKSTSPPQPMPPVPPMPSPSLPLPDKTSTKTEKAKSKLFSRPSKIGTSKEPKEKALPSPGKLGTALSALHRGNFSSTSLAEPPAASLFSHNNSSSTTIRPSESFTEERGKEKEKEKKHHFLSRQKQKLKDEYHLSLSSAASNSKPTDPNAPSSLYNFNIPVSPAPASSGFSKTKKEKKLADRSESRLDAESTFGLQDWSGSVPSLSQQSTIYDPIDPGKLGLQNHMSPNDAWPYLKAKLLVVFEGEDLRLPVEDFNRVVQMHIKWCIHKRSPASMVDDLRDLLNTGFSALDRSLRLTSEDRFIPTLVELWMFTFTSILPYVQSVFLPLDLEVSGCGIIMTPEQSRDFWGSLVPSPTSMAKSARVALASKVLDVRRLVLTSFRDIVILSRYDTLKPLFSRLSLEFIPSMALASPPPMESNLSASPSGSFTSMVRPGTAMSADPSFSVGSYTSNGTTLFGDGSDRGRGRALSNVSFGSHVSDGAVRSFTPSSAQVLDSVLEENVDGSKQVTEMVGRMLQCMSVLSSLDGLDDGGDEGGQKMVELCKMLKLNWLGRGRTGRNRRGIVGGRVLRDEAREEVRVA